MTLLSVFLQRDLVNRFGPARICQDRSGRDGLWSSLPAASVPESWRRPAHEQHAKDQGGTPERQRNHRKETVKETVPCTASTCLHAILLKAKRSCVSPKQWSLVCVRFCLRQSGAVCLPNSGVYPLGWKNKPCSRSGRLVLVSVLEVVAFWKSATLCLSPKCKPLLVIVLPTISISRQCFLRVLGIHPKKCIPVVTY